MTVYNFAGVADGQPWPSPWTTKGIGTHTADVQVEEGRIVGTTASFQPGGASIHQAQAQADLDLAMAFRFTALAANSQPSLVVRGTYGGGQLLHGYRLDVHNGTSGIAVVREVSAADTVLATFAGVDVDDLANYVARMRVRTVGATVEIDAKVWLESAEESDWQIQVVDSSASRITTAGEFAVHMYSPITSGTPTTTMLVREVEVVNPATFDYTAPVLTATLDDSDYTVDLSWTGAASDVEIQRETWAGQGEPWL